MGEFISGGSSLKDTDFSNDTDLSGIDVDQHISAWYIMHCGSIRSVTHEERNMQSGRIKIMVKLLLYT